MKHLASGIISLFIVINSYSQAPIEKELQNIIKMQMFGTSEKVVPLVIAMPGWFMLGQYTHYDNEIFFSAKANNDQNRVGFSQIVESEIQNNLPLVYSSSGYPKHFQLNAYYGDNLSVTVKASQTDSTAALEIINADGSFRREAKYSDQRLKYLAITNSNGSYITQYEYSDSITRKTQYNTVNKNYQTIDEYYKGNVLLSRVTYKSSKSRKTLHIKYREEFTFDNENRPKSILKFMKNNQLADSVNFLYTNNSTTEIHSGPDFRRIITYSYKLNHAVIEKRIDLPENKIDIKYDYDESSRLAALDIVNLSSDEKTRYTFSYDSESRLGELCEFTYAGSTDGWFLKDKFMFDYNSQNDLESISSVQSNGHVSRLLHYDLSIQQ